MTIPSLSKKNFTKKHHGMRLPRARLTIGKDGGVITSRDFYKQTAAKINPHLDVPGS